MIMKHIKPLAALAAGILFGGMCALPASAARLYPECNENIGVYDVQGVLSSDEEEQMNALIRETADAIDMYVAVVIVGPETPFTYDSDVVAYADDTYDMLFNPEADVDTDGILLLINNSTKYDYISTCGLGQFYYTNDSYYNRVDLIFDDIWDAVLAEDYTEVIVDFCFSIERYYDMGIPDNYYIEEPGKGYGTVKNDTVVWRDRAPIDIGELLTVIAIAVVVGGITALVIWATVNSRYKFKTSLNPTNYVCRNNCVMHESSDTFLRTYTTKTRIQSSSGGGGGGRSGGRSHRSGGGHSHGGGGRRR